MKRSLLTVLVFFALNLTGLGFASAQEKKPDGKPDRTTFEQGSTVALTRFLEAYRAGDFEKAEGFWSDVIKENPDAKTSVNRLFQYAQCQFGQNKAEKRELAAATIGTLLERDPTHIQGLFLLARIRALSEKQQQKEAAKDLLLNAARNGFFVLKEIFGNKDLGTTFDYLKQNPQFILQVMKASQEFQVAGPLAKARNPFQTPWRMLQQDTGRDNPGDLRNRQRAEELESEIDKIFEDIEKLARDQKVDELIPKFADLNKLMQEYGGLGTQKVQEKLAKWGKRLEEYKELKLAIELQVDISTGNQYLEAMAKSIQQEKFDDVFEKFALLKTHVEKMKHQERDEFQRNADALFIRGKALDDEARKLKKIKEFNLIVTGIVIDPRPDSKDRAIINNKIYEVGDPVVDKDDNEIPGLRVVKIAEGSVKFRYEDTEFFRQLKSEDPSKGR